MEQETVLKGFGIVVADRGYVYVGELAIDGNWCVISNAQNVRRWGTTKGLGELALNGNNGKTVLDASGTVRVPQRAIIHILDSEKQKWNY